MGNTHCGDCMSEDAANGERRSYLPEDPILDQLNRKSDAARYAIKYPYRPAPGDTAARAWADRDPRPTLNLEGDPGFFTTPCAPSTRDKLDLSISLSDIRQVRDSVPLSEIRVLQPGDLQESPGRSFGVSKRRPETYQHAYQVPDYFERPGPGQQRQASKKPAYLQEQKENLLFVPAARQRASAESVQIGRQQRAHYYY